MVDIEPFKYQASTNIKEHNEIVDKVNEIVGVINDINLDGLDPRLTADEANIKKNTEDIAQLKISDNEHTAQINTLDSNVDNHAREITNLKASDAKQNSDITALNTLTDALTKELPTEITLYRDGTGKIRAQVTKEDNTTFDSNTLDMIIPYQYSIISGTSARSFKLDITTSDGNHIITNDFLIPEGGGTDITVTSVTLIKDPTNSNKVKVSIGLSDGTPLESGYVEMVNAVSGTFANNKLTITVNGVSSVPINIDNGGSGAIYTGGVGITINSDNVISIADDYTIAISELFLMGAYYDDSTKTLSFFNYKQQDTNEIILKNLASLTDVDNKISPMETKVNNCYDTVNIVDNTLVFFTVEGDQKNIVLPGGSGDYVPSSYPVENGGKILGINGDGTVVPKDSEFVEPLFKPNLNYTTSPSTFMTFLRESTKIGNMVTFFALGKTASSWSCTISGIVTSKSESSVTMNYIGGTLQENGTVLTIGAPNYNNNPVITFSTDSIHVNIVKGNAITGRNLSWNDVQGYNVIIYR